MKKVLSLFILVLLVVGIFSVVPASAQTYTEIDCPKLVNCADLKEKAKEQSIKGAIANNLPPNSTYLEVFKLVVPEDSWVFMLYDGYTTTPSYGDNNELGANLDVYDETLTKILFHEDLNSEGYGTIFRMKKIYAGTYFVKISRDTGNSVSDYSANLSAYFGYFPLDTQFFSIDLIESKDNSKDKTFKLNTLDTISDLFICKTNGPGNAASFWNATVIGKEYKLDDNGCFVLNVGEPSYGYCYYKFGIKDVFGNEFINWYGVITKDTTVIENVPETVEYTGKPITLKDLKVITGYSHSNCATYDVKYENNTDVGTAKVIITGNGNFVGKVVKTFKIVHTKHKNITKTTKKPTYFNKGKKTTTCSVCGKISTSTVAKLKLKVPSVKITTKSKKIFVKYNKVTGAAGFEVRYKLTTSKKWITKTFKTSKSTTKFINNLKKDKKYNVGVRSFALSSSKKAYSLWSSSKTLKIK